MSKWRRLGAIGAGCFAVGWGLAMFWAVARFLRLEGDMPPSFGFLLSRQPVLPLYLVLLCHAMFLWAGIWCALKGVAVPAQALLVVCCLGVLHVLWVMGAPITGGMPMPLLVYPLSLALEAGRAAIGGGVVCLLVSAGSALRSRARAAEG
jgi:hypothetical protein